MSEHMLDKLHDADLLAVIISDTNLKETTLRFKSVEPKIYEVTLHNVQHFRCNNFLEGNTVFEVSVLKNILISIEPLLWMLEQYDDHKYAESFIERIQQGKLTFIKVDSSYGAQIVAVAETIEINSL
jgi:ribosome biogenesis GTPase A